jgi:hypothetical protein
MYSLIQLKTLFSCGRDPARSLPLRRGFLLIPLILVCFAFSPKAQAAPAPETPDPGAVGGTFSTADGTNALVNVTTGAGNSAFGWFSLSAVTGGSFNTGLGAGTLVLNNANSNTAVGTASLLLNTAGSGLDTGTRNTAVGTAALVFNTGGANQFEGSFNDAVGAFALNQNTIGSSNNAFGDSALFNNVIGAGNTAVGDVALASNDSSGLGLGNANTAVGAGALFFNVDGDSNNAVGFDALVSNVDGLFNNAVGFNALADNVSGAGNTAIGDSAGAGNTSGDFNTYVGVGGAVVDGESDTIRIGDPVNGVACFIGGIFGVTTGGGGLPVFVDANGQLGTIVSSARFKNDIKPMDKASEAILSLKPVTFHYKSDKSGTPQFGLVAEEVAAVNPDLVVRDRNGEILTVRYEAVNAMLLNEFLKEHRTVTELQSMAEKQQATIALQEGQIKSLTASLREQAAQIQKVSAQIEMIRPAPQVVENR